jgi:V8-like Glu-specific endopeptidase
MANAENVDVMLAAALTAHALADPELVDTLDAVTAGPVRYPPTRAPSGVADLVASPTARLVRKPYTNLPDRTIGRVFFTATPGGDQSCSAVALNSTNKSVVWTAGHCVESGTRGGFHTNWVFVPAYGSCGSGCRPYGTFRGIRLLTTQGWADDGNLRADIGAAVVAPIGGRRLVQVVGGQGFAAGEIEHVFRTVGYPADPPFTGRQQRQCTGPSPRRDDAVPGVGPAPMALACDMTGGASGGPWLIELGTNGLGYVNGNISYRYRNDPATLFSPYYGDDAVSLYDAVSTAPVR